MNTNTALGNTLRVAIWVVASAILVAGLSAVVDRPELFSPQVVAVANILLVLAKGLVDPKVKNV